MRRNRDAGPFVGAGTALLLALVAGCSAGPPPLSGKTVTSRCLETALPVETVVSLFGVYEGAPGPGERERRAGEHRPMRVQVETRDDFGPEVLILSSYEPVIWDVSAVAANDLRGVIVYGYYRSELAGAPAALPVRHVAFRRADDREATPDGAPAACGEPLSVHEGGLELEALDAQATDAVGLPIAHFAGAYSTARLALDDPRPGDPDEARRTADRPDRRPGIEAVNALVAGGAIRLATGADIAAWNAKASAQLRSSRLAPFVSDYLRTGDTYVVLRGFTVPEGMNGARARNFIIPEGVAMPVDGGSHNGYYPMAGGQCVGPSPDCRRRDRTGSLPQDGSFRPKWRDNPWGIDGG
jgi:hypothetical protein